jgi:hypothetical protein
MRKVNQSRRLSLVQANITLRIGTENVTSRAIGLLQQAKMDGQITNWVLSG